MEKDLFDNYHFMLAASLRHAADAMQMKKDGSGHTWYCGLKDGMEFAYHLSAQWLREFAESNGIREPEAFEGAE